MPETTIWPGLIFRLFLAARHPTFIGADMGSSWVSPSPSSLSRQSGRRQDDGGSAVESCLKQCLKKPTLAKGKSWKKQSHQEGEPSHVSALSDPS